MKGIDDQLDRIALADKGKPRKKVVILGAGMAGLVAAYELSKLGHTVSVIEATKRVGGRVWTHEFPDKQYNELGAMRIPPGHDYTRHYIAEVGLTNCLRPFISSHQEFNHNCFYFFRGKRARIREASATIFGEYHLSAHERMTADTLRAPGLFGIHLENTLKSLNYQDRAGFFGERFLTDRAAELEGQSLGEFLDRRVESDDAKELIGAVTGLEPWWEMAVTMFLRDEIVGTSDGLEEIKGGMSRLPNNLADKLGRKHIRFNTEVVSIECQEHGARLWTRPTSPDVWDCPPKPDAPISEEKADYVICAIPFGVLRRMSLSGLSALKMRAIRNLNYASSTKVLLHCKERFWEMGPPEDRIIGGASLTDLITRATYYPSDHAAGPPRTFAQVTGREGFRSLFSSFAVEGSDLADAGMAQSPGPGVLLGSYNWGRDARRLGGLPTTERAKVVVNVLENIHPGIGKYVDDDASMAWDTYRWSMGAFCFMQPGDLRSYYHAAIRPEGTIHFAGEHCSLDQGWIQGAAMSGVRVVEEVVRR